MLAITPSPRAESKRHEKELEIGTQELEVVAREFLVKDISQLMVGGKKMHVKSTLDEQFLDKMIINFNMTSLGMADGIVS